MPEPLIAVPLSGWQDPASVHAFIVGCSSDSFWLDAGPSAESGWSWVGDGVVEDDPDRVRAVALAGAGPRDGWDAGRFRGGWIGWLGYEDAAARAGAPVSEAAPDAPTERWLRVERFVAFDHARRRAWAVAPAEAVEAFAAAVTAPHPGIGAPVPLRVQATGRHEPDAYAALIERCRDAIREGDAYQLCLTTRFTVDAEVDAVATYVRLRRMTPAHHGGLVRSGEFALASASPERFLEVEDGVVRTRPIKGTRPRGSDPIEDAALAEELRTSQKERAENVMIVDLMRNDLSRVCEPGSVGVEGLLEVESYPAVHQLVSTVSGTLTPDVTVGDLLDATFPAGSMTGAPKLSAMTILHELERGPRGVFAGCFGWIGSDGALDLAMVIRSIVVHPGGAYVGAGGGITWRSEAAAEVAEVGVKARGPLAAIGADLPPGW
ncbi:aminodeoxychorismate synthase component I [Microbacterium sp. zg.B48]|uniref:aminodeoxychorismate synthase component I n=1 Tax=Microbacterium sp. zg.B48 TaxID=2969408 RepID=UPI00214BA165|nr:aminodeoxychorismate synthase component I [Microbacterium sp. zg.B48]MCR2765152.1 aminodeoxychorismate synthase component I [Microbacterium sp. zg.B48]